jgi:hypothetical protein
MPYKAKTSLKASTKTPRLVFPTNLSREGTLTAAAGAGANSVPNIPYIEFNAYKWHIDPNAKKNASIFIRRTSRGSVVLPLAEVISDQQDINWETVEGIGAKNVVELGLKKGIDMGRAALASISKYVESKAGATNNDLQSLAFGLTNFRDWNFSFKLLPKGQKDSQRLAEVIQFFKQESISNFTGNLIDYPSFFTVNIHFPKGESGTLFNKLLIFKASVMTNITINYLPDSVQSFYRDGAPTSVSLDLTLKELERVSRKEYNLGL